MTEVLKKAPDQSALWKDKKNRLPEPWCQQFLYLLFHRDAGLVRVLVFAALRSVRASCALFFTCRYIIQTPMALSDSAVSPETLSCKLPVFLLYYLITYIEYLVL